jgi:hypothetical protein
LGTAADEWMVGNDQPVTQPVQQRRSVGPVIGTVPAVDDAAAVPPLAGSVGNQLFGRAPDPAPSEQHTQEQGAEVRALRIEVDRLRARLADEAAYRTELEAALTVLTARVDPEQVEEILPDAFEQFFNAEDPQHTADRDFLLH